MRRFATSVLILAVVSVAPSHAIYGQGAPAEPRQDAKVSAGGGVRDVVVAARANAARAISIHGSAWQANNTPIPFARIRLRNLATGQICAAVTADEEGQFVFESVSIGAYLVELVSDAGKVLAVGHTFSVSPGETVATFVRLGSKVPWFSGFFGNAALAVASAAAAAGLTAVAPEEVRPISGRQ